MIAPNDAVEAIWRGLVERPSRWGDETGAQAHPLVDGLFTALGTVLTPVGFLVSLLLIILVLPAYAIVYDLVQLVTRPVRGRYDRP